LDNIGGVVETILIIAGLTFAAVMIYLLPKYAKFIHQQPKLRLDQIRKQEEEKDKNESKEN
jgi:choline-glycine betaine transporter